jgi:glycosyltransferase involved in cell wall biosynthesis
VTDAVSAIVCTRNRPGPIARAVESLLGDCSESIEFLVLDQSDGPETERALDRFRADRRLRYLRSATRGKGAALNEGLRIARGSIVVCTDDDCEVPAGWVSEMARVLQSQPTAAIAFCQVLPVPHDRRSGYVPAFELRASRLVRSIVRACSGLGLGAGMALRRDFVLSIGGFDESFGPGARFPSADEWDMALRALLTGRHVYETTDLAVVHDGFRTFEEGRLHARRDWLAIGALCAKPLRAGYFRAVMIPLWIFSTRALWPPVADVLRLRRPSGLTRIVAFLEGFAQGLRTPVDRKTLRFVNSANRHETDTDERT